MPPDHPYKLLIGDPGLTAPFALIGATRPVSIGTPPAPLLHVAGRPARVVTLHAPGQDISAFRLLFQRYYPVVIQWVAALSEMQKEQAEDVAQDIFLRLWQRGDRLTGIVSPENYLFMMTRNRLINEQKKTQVAKKAYRHLAETIRSSADTTEELLDDRALRCALQEAVRLLPPRTRMAYELREGQQLKKEEIALVMGITPSVAKQHLLLAAKRIRSHIRQHTMSR